jgi:quinol monooxygenase YgiN
MENPIAVTGLARALPERAGEFRAALLSLAEKARNEEGCLEYHVHLDVNEQDTLVLYEVWRSAEDLNAHLARPSTTAFMDDRMQYLREDIEVRVLDMQSPYFGPAA